MADEEGPPPCSGVKNDVDDLLGVRIGAIFVIFATSAIFTLFPIITRRFPKVKIPELVYDMFKFFGSGVIIATGFIHLLQPADEELSQPCLNEDFQNYPMAYAFALISMMLLFMGEYLAYRLGTKILQNRGYDDSALAHHHAPAHAHAQQSGYDHVQAGEYGGSRAVDESDDTTVKNKLADEEAAVGTRSTLTTDSSELVGIFVLEFGVIFHSVIIGLTLATSSADKNDDDHFQVLFPVIVFHQLFEGLGLGSRLAFLPPSMGSWLPIILGLAYAIVTPIGMAIGLGLRTTYTQDTATGYYVTGIFDSFSAGILIYTGLVELLAHDFIFSERMRAAPLWHVLLNMFWVCAGIGVMALLGRWA